MFHGFQHAAKNQQRRIEVVEVDDSGDFMKITAIGLPGEIFEFSYHKQSHGFTAHPVKGAIGTAMLVNGKPDQAILMSMESDDIRPKNLKEGEVELYAQAGQTDHLKDDGTRDVFTPGECHFR